ncbi:MAG: riboflavin synthase [Candidatus Korobacteraceae bacterium]|jgi:riboflavin synthase
MFTGIVEEVGRIARIEQKGENRRIVIEAQNIPGQLKTGDSCAVSGVCLTALAITPTSFAADLAPETWVRTSLSRITEGAKVNLELPLRADGRMGGHMVQGHVDGVGKLMEFERIANSDDYWLHVEVPAELEKYLVYKGSIAIEGISLTVARLEGLVCTIAIIPHTVEMTNLGTLKPGDPVNIETDIVAKYLEKWMRKPESAPLKVETLVAKGF